MNKKPCMLDPEPMVFAECALCCGSDDPAAKKCASNAEAIIANDYNRLNTRKGTKHQ